MRSHPFVRPVLALVLALLVTVIPAAVVAAPMKVESDRTDNDYSFTYDAAGGEITLAQSSVRFNRRDPVSFTIYVQENSKSDEVGQRLRARLSVALNPNKDGVVRYEGTFSFEITDSEGTVEHGDSRDLKVVLRPKPGERKASLSFVFDLPSGDHNAKGFFEGAE